MHTVEFILTMGTNHATFCLWISTIWVLFFFHFQSFLFNFICESMRAEKPGPGSDVRTPCESCKMQSTVPTNIPQASE